MSSDKIYQVFVSSTFTDLEDERRLVSNSLAKAGYIVAGMELFPATDEDQFDYIKRIIDRSDYYLVIVGGRYGTRSDDGLSFTEKEFDYAQSKGLKAIPLLHKNPGTLPADKCDRESDQIAALEKFKKKLKTGRMTDFWHNKDDLCTRAVIAIMQSATLFPATGWIRGDYAIDPKVLQETERLRIENAELRSRLVEQFNTLDVAFDPKVKGPDMKLLLNITGDMQSWGVISPEPRKEVVEAEVGDIFLYIYDDLLSEEPEKEINETIAHCFTADSEPIPEKFTMTRTIDRDDLIVIRTQLEALGLIAVRAQRDGDGDRYLTWSLVDKGRRYFASRAALRAND